MAPVIQDSDEEDYSDVPSPNNHKKSTKTKYEDSDSELSDPGELDLDDDEEDEDEDEDDDDDEVNDTTHYSEGEVPISDDEEAYQLEDLDDIDEDLELKDEEAEEEVIKPSSVKISVNSGSASAPRKRVLTYYEDDEANEESNEYETVKPATTIRRVAKVQPTDLDADLILTDEETEYNPHANLDLAKLTSRQRAMYDEEEDGKATKFFELDDNPVKPKKKKKETDQEMATRKAESARRRQDYKNKQLEEEKRDTLNKLLKRRATKTREVSKEGTVEVSKVDKPIRPSLEHPALFRYVNNTTFLKGNSVLAYNPE